MDVLINVIFFALILGLTYALMSEGLWGAALMFFNVLFAGIITFNFYEMLAGLIAGIHSVIAPFADSVSMLTIFSVSVVVLRLTTESLAPAMVRFPTPVYHAGRALFAFGASAITFAIILLALETAPVHKKVLYVYDYQAAPPFKMGLDRQWLGFFQYTTGLIFADYGKGKSDPYGTYKYSPKLFDPRSEWLLIHQEARPYGKGSVLGESSGESGGDAAPAGEGGAAAPGGATSSSGGGSRPGDPAVVGPAVGGGVVIPQ
jgi:uncharacterized membrane protein YgcG